MAIMVNLVYLLDVTMLALEFQHHTCVCRKLDQDWPPNCSCCHRSYSIFFTFRRWMSNSRHVSNSAQTFDTVKLQHSTVGTTDKHISNQMRTLSTYYRAASKATDLYDHVDVWEEHAWILKVSGLFFIKDWPQSKWAVCVCPDDNQ